MIAALDTIFFLTLLCILPLYVMYFTAIYYFGKNLVDQHPDVYARLTPAGTPRLAGSYLALVKLQKDKALLSSLSPTVQEQFRSASRYLLLGTLGFLIMVLAGVCSAVMSKA
jgi:hypothetical protein